MLSRPLVIALVITGGLSFYAWWKDSQESEPELDARPRSTAPRASTAAQAVPSHAVQASAAGTAASAAMVNLFPRQNWAPPPTPTPAPPPPPPPTAPPLPFVMVASWHENGADQYFVEAQGQQIVLCTSCNSMGRVRPGDTLLGVYRLDKISRDMLHFTYLPLNQQQQLPTGGTP